MSTLVSTTEHAPATGGSTTTILGALKRAWVAYMTWRIEVGAATALRTMSDHDLHDLGIGRSDIAYAVKFGNAKRR
jgi:uncharacterized protein YjiS (DUF1127 family)